MNEAFFLRKRLVNQYTALRNLQPDSLLKLNTRFKDIHKGDRCFILGSGPTIKQQDLTILKDEIVITQNHFHSHKDIKIIDPKYHVVVPMFHPKEYDEDWISWIRGMEEKLPDNCTYFFGKNTQSLIHEKTGLKDNSFYIKTGYHAIVSKKARIDITKSIFNIPTVITQCLTIALYMGFKEIFLTGFDMDTVCQAVRNRDNMRFYGHSEITNNDGESAILNSNLSTGKHFFNHWTTWQQLILLRRYAEANNIKITNVSAGGILNVFPLGDFETVVNNK